MSTTIPNMDCPNLVTPWTVFVHNGHPCQMRIQHELDGGWWRWLDLECYGDDVCLSDFLTEDEQHVIWDCLYGDGIFGDDFKAMIAIALDRHLAGEMV